MDDDTASRDMMLTFMSPIAPSSPTMPSDLRNSSGFEEHGVRVETPKAEASSVTGDFTSQNDTTVTGRTQPVGSDTVIPGHLNDGEEDRTNLTTFTSWGAPAVRDKPGIYFVPRLVSVLTCMLCLSCSSPSYRHQGFACCLVQPCQGLVIGPRWHYREH